MEADTIGNLLPDEDDLFSGVVDELGCSSHAKTIDDFEDFDLFSSGGGMEMEGDEHLSSGKIMNGLDGDYGFFGGSKGKLPFGEQPSRTLFVRNINSNVEDSELKDLFEVRLYSCLLHDVILDFSGSISYQYSKNVIFVLTAIWGYPNHLYSL